MQIWQELLKTALVGTERQELSLTPTDDAAGALLKQLDGTERERSALRGWPGIAAPVSRCTPTAARRPPRSRTTARAAARRPRRTLSGCCRASFGRRCRSG